jgi:hypothetical protein
MSLSVLSAVSEAQSIRGLPSLPTSGGLGFQGSVGVGFTDFKTQFPSNDFKLDRGTYFSAQLERGFDVLHLYLTLGLNYQGATGTANYEYTNLSSSAHYAATDMPFKASMYEVSLGLKMKLIDNYWFRPYIEAGGIGSYNQVAYDSRMSSLGWVGHKATDVIMGSGYYGEGGVEVMFTPKWGVKLAARQAFIQTKKLETLNNLGVRLQNEIYYFSLLFGM